MKKARVLTATMKEHAEALAGIAGVLEPMSNERACAVMAAAAALLGHYDEARRFAELAAIHKADSE